MTPPPAPDPAIFRALNLSPSPTIIFTLHGVSGFNKTHKLVQTSSTHPPATFFIKTGIGASAATMFAGEHVSLNALNAAHTTLCPRSFAHGALEDTEGGFFLATEFLDFNGGMSRGEGKRDSLAIKLAKLHTASQPDGRRFGFEVPTCCGATEQDNTWEDDWPTFFGRRRLLAVLAENERKNGEDKELRKAVEETVETVVPTLLGALGKVKPVCVHGDLWSGNSGRARILGPRRGTAMEEVVFDSSACYAHNEYELGIMKMFGGFGTAFLREYHALVPKSEPVAQYGDRVELYMLYHQLNHHALFGSGYRSGAMDIMNRLGRKYGGGAKKEAKE